MEQSLFAAYDFTRLEQPRLSLWHHIHDAIGVFRKSLRCNRTPTIRAFVQQLDVDG